MLAAHEGHTAIASKLVSAGADKDMKCKVSEVCGDPSQGTCFTMRCGHTESPDSRFLQGGLTALMIAAALNRKGIVDLLLRAGAGKEEVDEVGL
jgi:ankyrin repeat protein